MSVEEKIKKIICEQLEVDEKDVIPEASFVVIWEQTHSIK